MWFSKIKQQSVSTIINFSHSFIFFLFFFFHSVQPSSRSPDSGVAGALYVCGKIEKSRVKATQKYLVKGDLLFAWITWTGSSVAMCVFAALICCYQPACTSSGIPGLIAYLNGVKPLGGKSHFTGTRFLLLLFLIVGHSFLFFQIRSPFSVFFLDLFVFFGDDFVTAGKQTSFVSVKTMLFKLVGMIASIPSGLAIGPEGKRRKASGSNEFF